MKTRAIILSILLALASATSCITLTVASLASSAAYAFETRPTRIKGTTIKQINDKAAIIQNKSGEVYCIVYPFSPYEDGMEINDRFRRGGIYEYDDELSGTKKKLYIYVLSSDIENLAETAIHLDHRYQEQDKQPTYQI